MKRYLTIGLLLLLWWQSNIHAQEDLRIGEWRQELPFQQVIAVDQNDEKIIYATEEAILMIDKDEFSVETLSKINGLSDTGITAIRFDDETQTLIVTYSSSVIDLIRGSEVITVTDIATTAAVQGDKTINSIYSDDGYAYFATGFGLVQYDLEMLEFGFTLDISRRVNDVSGQNDVIVIGLDDGAYALDVKQTAAPGFFDNWDNISEGFAPDTPVTKVMGFNGVIYIVAEQVLFTTDMQGNFDLIFENERPNSFIQLIRENGDQWLLGVAPTADPFFSDVSIMDQQNQTVNAIGNCSNRLLDAVIDERGRIFYADRFDGIRYNDSDGNCLFFDINSPQADDANQIDIIDNTVYVASGGASDNFSDLFGRDGFYVFENKSWTNFNDNSEPFLPLNDIIQIGEVAAKPRGDKIYFGSFWAGVVEYDVEQQRPTELYNETNSSLRFVVGDDRVRISGLTFDDDNNLWVSNFGAVRPLSVFTDEGTWHSFEWPVSADTRTSELDVDQRGQLWVTIGGTNGGIVLYNPGDDVADPFDDTTRFINQTNSELQTSIINTVEVDLDGSVWVGSNAGAVVFEGCTTDPASNCQGNRRLVSQDNFNAFLLETEDVLSIAVDGANRKWFGTRNGVFVQSPSGQEQIANFNEDNSQLLDNTIRDMKYNPENGEMWIATDGGMQVFKTITVGAERVHNDVYAYPNPVRPDYTGPIAVRGLVQEAEVTITDIDGQLVFRTNSLGGQAIWDGIDLNGNAVAGGVYLVFSSSTDTFRDIDSFVTKILIIR